MLTDKRCAIQVEMTAGNFPTDSRRRERSSLHQSGQRRNQNMVWIVVWVLPSRTIPRRPCGVLRLDQKRPLAGLRWDIVSRATDTICGEMLNGPVLIYIDRCEERPPRDGRFVHERPVQTGSAMRHNIRTVSPRISFELIALSSVTRLACCFRLPLKDMRWAS